MLIPRAVTRGEFDSPDFQVSVDWCSFTFFPANASNGWKHDLEVVLDEFFGATGWEARGGWQGYECSARVGEVVLVAWGGAAQKGSVHVEIPGGMCGMCRDWAAFAAWLEAVEARLTRVDIAGDDYFAKHISIPWAVEKFHGGEFSFQGMPPSAKLIDDLGSKLGKTLYVGKRQNGKLCRVYEKGKELGDATSPWVRFEVEWRAKNRHLAFDMLTRPAEYLAGSYPCASLFARLSARVRTFKERSTITFARMVANARQQCGRAVNAILQVNGGDLGEVVALLRRSGLPKRFSAFDVYALQGAS